MSCAYSISRNNKDYYTIGTVPNSRYCKGVSGDRGIFDRTTHCCYIEKADLNTTLYGYGRDYTDLGLTSPQALFLYGLVGVILGWQFGKNLWGYS